MIPVATPIAFLPLKGLAQAHFGRIAPGHSAHAAYRALLGRTLDEPFALLVPP